VIWPGLLVKGRPPEGCPKRTNPGELEKAPTNFTNREIKKA